MLTITFFFHYYLDSATFKLEFEEILLHRFSGGKRLSVVLCLPVMNQVIQQRIMLENERRGVIQNPGLTILGGCDRIHQHHKVCILF